MKSRIQPNSPTGVFRTPLDSCGRNRLAILLACFALGAGAEPVRIALTQIVPGSNQAHSTATEAGALQVSQPADSHQKPPKTLAHLLALPTDRLGEVDVGLTNLLCAEGLVGAERLDATKVLATLDLWAAAVKGETERQAYQFKQRPQEFENSEPFFKMLVLLTVLQQDLGVKYNIQRVNAPNFSNAKDQFIHGMINCDNGGTCVSMPVLYVAVGRRLGYPMKLVLAREHVFVRWDDGKKTMNFEGAGVGGETYKDEYYRSWPLPITDEDMKHREFLVSLTPPEELALFLAARGHCLTDNNRLSEAKEAYAAALKLMPTNTAYAGFVERTEACLKTGKRLVLTKPPMSPRNPVPSPQSAPQPTRGPFPDGIGLPSMPSHPRNQPSSRP